MSEIIKRAVDRVIDVLALTDHPDDRKIAEQVVCSVIAALREPTEAMKLEGARRAPDYDPGPEDADDIWKGMIDEALK